MAIDLEVRTLYPDYLQKFEGLMKFADNQKSMLKRVANSTQSEVKEALCGSIGMPDRWKKTAELRTGASNKQYLYNMFTKRFVAKAEDFDEIIEGWIARSEFVTEYDDETKTFVVKTTLTPGEIGRLHDKIRHLVPYNLNCSVQSVAEL